jgi:hypothetical protein
MMDKMDKINAIASEAQRINHRFHKTAKTAYEFARKNYADPKYEVFRTSDKGRAWKKHQLAQYNHRCPECYKPINGSNANIDHKHPRRYYPWMAWDINNLWILCIECNEAKSDMEWGSYLATVRKKRGQAVVDRILKYAPPASPDR